ncbi:MAG: divalent-cation tolerance protein CutA [Thermoplasmata archaeon]|nr:divalent-cation tolerance protein CutA [Thermoplasmata archaeon]
MLFIKTTRERWEEIKNKILELHSYTLPEIICLDMKGSNEYLKWIDGVVK